MHASQLCKPLSNYATQLGGGCELALMCDIILASPTAVFGQPEINLGVIPGGGGTQRLIRAIGKSRTMELTLTGRNFSAVEAESWGVVSRVVGEGEGQVVKDAVHMAEIIAKKGRLAVQAGKEAVNTAYELTLAEGLRFERRLFHGLFATQDQKEGPLFFFFLVPLSLNYVPLTSASYTGMTAFAEKRKPKWSHS